MRRRLATALAATALAAGTIGVGAPAASADEPEPFSTICQALGGTPNRYVCTGLDLPYVFSQGQYISI